MGAFERAAMRIGLVREIDAFDISTASLADAKREADREGLTGINYMVGSFDDPHLVRHRYDIVFFHASLHHVSALERLFRRLSVALKPHGAIYVDEYVGPSRHDWRPEDLQLAQALLDLLPPAAKVGHTIDLPIQMDDPSEAVRSSEIRRFVQDFFRMIEWRPYGGQVVDLIFPYLDPAWASSPEGIEAIGSLLRVEDWALSLDTSLSHYAVGYGFLRPLPALIRPLARQGVAAVRRRLPTFS
jgi:SAM-dependent methyltransferase